MRWRRPKVTVYRPADQRLSARFNRYGAVNGRGGAVIGVCIVLFGRAWSLVWGRPVVRRERVSGPTGEQPNGR